MPIQMKKYYQITILTLIKLDNLKFVKDLAQFRKMIKQERHYQREFINQSTSRKIV